MAVVDTTTFSLLDRLQSRYLLVPEVRDWLLSRDPHPIEHVTTLDNSFSYACMYYPPSYVPPTDGPYPLPRPFLDIGDFVVSHRIHNGIAIGTLFNPVEQHALSIARDSMLNGSRLSRRPRVRSFASDLRQPFLEIVEFAWMDDESLIVSCRRFKALATNASLTGPVVLSADLLFFPVVPADSDPFLLSPLLRMTVAEGPSLCQFCGVCGLHACSCPVAYKVRASPVFPNTAHTKPTFDPPPFANSSLDMATTNSSRTLDAWHKYVKTLFSCQQKGTFYCQWFKRSSSGTGLTNYITPRHPIPYQVATGSRQDTLRLTSIFIAKLRIAQRGLASDLRLSPPNICRSPVQQGPRIPYITTIRQSRPPVYIPATSRLTYVNHHDTLPPSRRAIHPMEDSLDNSDTAGYWSRSVSHAMSLLSNSLDESSTSLARDHSPRNEPPVHAVSHVYPPNMRSPLPGDTPSPDDTDHNALTVAAGSPDSADAAGDMPAECNKTSLNRSPTSVVVDQSARMDNNSSSASNTERRLLQYMTVDQFSIPTCKKCHRAFPKRSNLKRHIKTVHLRLRPFQCEECHKFFFHNDHLKRHKQQHLKRPVVSERPRGEGLKN